MNEDKEKFFRTIKQALTVLCLLTEESNHIKIKKQHTTK
jgi:hypothetical protein